MAPTATAHISPLSSLEEILNISKSTNDSSHPSYFHHLALAVLHDLQYQHEWTFLTIHTHSNITGAPLPRPVISGLPPRRAYIHPDEQTEILKAEHVTGQKIEYPPEREWCLPTQLQEKMSLSKFAAVFDALDVVPPGKGTITDDKEEQNPVGLKWQGKNRQKRLLLATLHDDSTIVYYIMHDGLVKPRQN